MKRVKEYFHWLFVVAPLLSIIIAWFGGIEEKVIEFILIPSAILINVIIVWLKSYFDADEEQNLIRSFLTDDLLPNRSGKPLVFETKIVVVEDDSTLGPFIKSLEKQFKSKTESKERNLILIPITCDTSNKEAQTKKLRTKLKGANAVVVVRTKELEDKSWVYEAIDSWAYERSDVPILFTEIDESDRKSSIPDKYFSIPSDPKSLPWRLMQRANERGKAWRNVATFNRFVATNCLILLVMSFLIGHFMILRQGEEKHSILARQEEEKRRVLGLMFGGIIKETKDQYFQTVITKAGDNMPVPSYNEFEVSYWFWYQGQIRQLITTEVAPWHKVFDFNKQSAIGCGFTFGNHITEWNEKFEKKNNGKYPIKIYDIRDNEKKDISDAEFFDEENRKMTSLVCSSNSGAGDVIPEHTVGICVFTESGKNIFGNDYRHFLQEKAREFYNRAQPLIKNYELIPLVE